MLAWRARRKFTRLRGRRRSVRGEAARNSAWRRDSMCCRVRRDFAAWGPRMERLSRSARVIWCVLALAFVFAFAIVFVSVFAGLVFLSFSSRAFSIGSFVGFGALRRRPGLLLVSVGSLKLEDTYCGLAGSGGSVVSVLSWDR